MTREILFKAKRSDGKGWVQGDLVTDGKYSKNNLFWIFPDDANEYNFDLLLKVIPETVCQYTGLKDKNGEKIFEGDIVRGFDNINKYTDPELAPHVEPTYTCDKYVEFIKGGFHLSSKKYPNGGCGNLQTYRPNRSEFIEIIGNIHDEK